MQSASEQINDDATAPPTEWLPPTIVARAYQRQRRAAKLGQAVGDSTPTGVELEIEDMLVGSEKTLEAFAARTGYRVVMAPLVFDRSMQRFAFVGPDGALASLVQGHLEALRWLEAKREALAIQSDVTTPVPCRRRAAL